MSLTLTEKNLYWKLRIRIYALDKILLNDSTPGISSSTKKILKKLLTKLTIRSVSSQGHDCVTTTQPEDLHEKDSLHEILHKVNLNNYVNMEVKILVKEIIEVYKEKLKRSELPNDLKLLQQLSCALNPMELILEDLEREILEETELDSEIEKWTRFRDTELEGCAIETTEMNEMLNNFKNDVMSGKYCAVMDQVSNFLQVEASFLRNKLKITNMRQTIAENPPEISNELAEGYRRLLEVKEKIERTVQDLKLTKTKYEALGPEFPKLLEKWKSYGEGIKNKEYVLQKLESEQPSFFEMNESYSFSIDDICMSSP